MNVIQTATSSTAISDHRSALGWRRYQAKKSSYTRTP